MGIIIDPTSSAMFNLDNAHEKLAHSKRPLIPSYYNYSYYLGSKMVRKLRDCIT